MGDYVPPDLSWMRRALEREKAQKRKKTHTARMCLGAKCPCKEWGFRDTSLKTQIPEILPASTKSSVQVVAPVLSIYRTPETGDTTSPPAKHVSRWSVWLQDMIVVSLGIVTTLALGVTPQNEPTPFILLSLLNTWLIVVVLRRISR